jgi:fructokinase
MSIGGSPGGRPASGLVIGEAFVDLIARSDGRETSYVPRFGGSPLNVAVGLRRLGTPVRLATTLAPDVFGTALAEFCAREDVDIRTLSTPVDRTFLAVATPREGRVAYEYFGDLASLTGIRPIDPRSASEAAVVHASSTAFLADPARSTVRRAVEAARGFTSLDPNPRPSLIAAETGYLDALLGLFGLVDLVKVSDEDLAYLFPGADPGEEALRLHRTYGCVVIVTRAASPTLLAHGDRVSSIEVPATRVVDATGAGDSFMASVLADVARCGRPGGADEWSDLIRRANQAAAATCQGIGGAESMPTARSLGRFGNDA